MKAVFAARTEVLSRERAVSHRPAIEAAVVHIIEDIDGLFVRTFLSIYSRFTVNLGQF